VDISIVVCTHNRSRLLRTALEHLLAQDFGGIAAELIVVDNGSADDTAEVVRQFAADSPIPFRHRFEASQGISFARNHGWALARGPIIAFTDDDVEVAPDWARRIVRTFEAHPEVECVGGRVLPIWPSPPPAWLTREHWAPLALLDYGGATLHLDTNDPRCLVGANLALRRETLTRLGGFSPAVQRVKDGIGSVEDHELLIRFWNAGGRALYVPELIATAPVDPQRLQKRYHRRWHSGHGHFYAVMRSPAFERSSLSRFLDVPGHLFRQYLTDVSAWVGCILSGRIDEAFLLETRMRFFWGFVHTRRRDRKGPDSHRRGPRMHSSPAIGRRGSEGAS
jgi:glycosyltransferase involved in cell wall biosynthesis